MTEYRWVTVPVHESPFYIAMSCPHCGGETEALQIEPPRSRSYANHCLLCTQCKRIVVTA